MNEINSYESVLHIYPKIESIRKKIGNTPLVKVPSAFSPEQFIYVKREDLSSMGTVKMRTAYGMVVDIIARSVDKSNLHILEYTGGSLGVCIAWICNVLEISLTLVLLKATSAEYKEKIRQYGAEIVEVESDKGFYAVIEKAKEMSQNSKYNFLYQHENPANLQIHIDTTGQEISDQIKFLIPDIAECIWCASIGTGGTLSGVTKGLDDNGITAKVYTVTPSEMPFGSSSKPNSLPKYLGSGGIGYGLKQKFVEEVDSFTFGHFHYSYKQSLEAIKKFKQLTGEKIGSSAGANWLAASSLAEYFNKELPVLTIFPSKTNVDEWKKVEEL